MDQNESQNEIIMPEVVGLGDEINDSEKTAFNRFVQENGTQIPKNFKSADDWFNSLKEAQKNYTQSKQEIAELKREYNNNGIQNPDYEPEAETPAMDIDKDNTSQATPSDWQQWSTEVDATGGLSKTSRENILRMFPASEHVIDQIIKGRKAETTQVVAEAADLVGGKANLSKLYSWAQENLSKEELISTNEALHSTAYKSVLSGLWSRYSSHTKFNKEPTQKPTIENSRPRGQEIQVFKSINDQNAALRDPRYRTDNSFRAAVQTMMVNTSRHGFKR
jgi:hypothetical protein